MSLNDIERIALQRWAKEPGAGVFIGLIRKKRQDLLEHYISQELQMNHAVLAWNNGYNAGMKYILEELEKYKKKQLDKE